MKAILQWGSGLVALLLFVSSSPAYDWASPVFKWPIQTAPDACGPGWYSIGGCGMVYGPNYYLVPPWMPFNGLLPGPGGQCLMRAQAGIPPWATQAGPYGARTPLTPYPSYPPAMPVPPNMPLPPYPVSTPMPPYPPATPMPPGTPRPPNAPEPPVPDNRTYTGVYPSHPYIRSPRDFFMWNEAMEDLRGQDVRPNLVIPR